MIRVQDLHKQFDGIEVLRGIDLQIENGEIVALVGRSGCGKSVLLKHITGLIKPNHGRVFIDGHDIGQLKGKDLLELRQRLGVLFQNGALFYSMTIFENVAFPLQEKTQLSDYEIRERVLGVLEQVKLAGSEEKYPSQISGGMVKRTSLARALVEEPEIMLFDEPTTGLDPVTKGTIISLIRESHEKARFSAVIVTHEVFRVFPTEEQALAQRIQKAAGVRATGLRGYNLDGAAWPGHLSRKRSPCPISPLGCRNR